MRPYVDWETLEPIDRNKILSHTNTFGVGLIMYCLATVNIAPSRDMHFLGDDVQHIFNVAADVQAQAPGPPVYSRELLGLIQECIAYDPAARPSFGRIIQSIDTAINEGGEQEGGLAQGMTVVSVPDHAATQATPVTVARNVLSFLPADMYQVSFDRAALPVK